MTPDQRRIQELERQVKLLTDFMLSFQSVPTVDPLVADTIKKLSVSISLSSLTDVTLSSPSNGQVLKYNGTNWYNGTDIDT